MEIYLLRVVDATLHAFLSFVHAMAIPEGKRVERLRAYKGREFIGMDSKIYYCRQKGVLMEYASTNTPQQIDRSERVGWTLETMVLCMLADSGLSTFLWGELIMFTAMCLANRAPHSMIGVQPLHWMLKGTYTNLGLFRVIAA